MLERIKHTILILLKAPGILHFAKGDGVCVWGGRGVMEGYL